MKILIDMNLPPSWVQFLVAVGYDAIHWSTVGSPRDPDTTILQFARDQGQVVFTHDLDFGALLAKTNGTGPSVLQVRTQDVLPDAIGGLVLRVIADHSAALAQGALVSIDEASARVRILPIK